MTRACRAASSSSCRQYPESFPVYGFEPYTVAQQPAPDSNLNHSGRTPWYLWGTLASNRALNQTRSFSVTLISGVKLQADRTSGRLLTGQTFSHNPDKPGYEYRITASSPTHKTAEPAAALQQREEADSGSFWDVTIGPGMDQGLIVLYAIIVGDEREKQGASS